MYVWWRCMRTDEYSSTADSYAYIVRTYWTTGPGGCSKQTPCRCKADLIPPHSRVNPNQFIKLKKKHRTDTPPRVSVEFLFYHSPTSQPTHSEFEVRWWKENSEYPITKIQSVRIILPNLFSRRNMQIIPKHPTLPSWHPEEFLASRRLKGRVTEESLTCSQHPEPTWPPPSPSNNIYAITQYK